MLVIVWTACGGGASGGGGAGGGGRGGGGKTTTPPAQPTDITPINGEAYYVLNQFSGSQGDLINNSVTPGDHVIQQSRSFTNLTQRWAFTALTGSSWKISNLANGFCLDSASSAGVTWVVQNPCAATATQQWMLMPASNGYYTITNTSTGLLIDLFQGATSAGSWLDQSPLSGTATQSQQWLLRPAFFRGVDNALLEKQESAHSKNGVPWWNDAGQAQDVLQILKNHGVNMIRLRPSSAPPYSNPSQPGCVGNLCYAETDAQDLDLAKRAKNLGMSVELTLLFDGGNSQSVPTAWTSDSFAQLQTDLYSYVKQEIMKYRQAGVMPDLVAIGNEVDTGFLGPVGSPTNANFPNFAALQKQGLKAVSDAAADTSIAPAIPTPLTCIHITPAWDLTSFFNLANQNGISYDAICQSYYPIYHGPLTDAQAAATNTGNKPVEQDVLNTAAMNLGKPIFIIETGEHYENGFQSNDPWYAPTRADQRQFLIDLQGVVKAAPNNVGMGIEYWDATGVNVPNSPSSYVNGDGHTDAIYTWNGLALFDDADSSGRTNANASDYSALLPGMDALGGKLDATLSYKFVSRSNGQILAVSQGSNQAGAQLNTAVDNGNPGLTQQWTITSTNSGYFQIASLNPGAAGTTSVLDDSGGSSGTGNPVVQSLANGSQEQEWDVVSEGNGYFNFVNRLSGLVLDLNGSGFAVQQSLSPNSQTQQWQIVAVH
jgi:arabinogalactan endo-1,4-beta-galactosidase